MYTNKGNKLVDKKVTGIESLANKILEADFSDFNQLAGDISRLFIQFSAEGYLAKRDQYHEDDRQLECQTVVSEAAARFYTHILPEAFAAFYCREGNEPIVDATKIIIAGLLADAFAIYLEGLPLAMAIFTADEYYPEPLEGEEDVEPDHIEAIEAVYVDEAVVGQLGLSVEDVGVYLEMLITTVMERFDMDSETYELFRPCVTVVKDQEKYFSSMADDYLWGKTEEGTGYVIFN